MYVEVRYFFGGPLRPFLRWSLAISLSRSFLGTVIKPFTSLSNRSKDWGVSSQLGGALIFFIYVPSGYRSLGFFVTTLFDVVLGR